MPEETTPVLKDPDPSVKQERKLILEGILRSIDEVGPEYIKRKNGKPDSFEMFFDGYYTRITIEGPKETRRIKYHGLIHSDCIDRIVQVYKQGNRTQIECTERRRNYL